MLQSESLYSEVSAALRSPSPHREPSPVLTALRLLGVHNETIAVTLGVSPPLVSFWFKGHERVAPKHLSKLVELLRAAHGEAVKALGEVAARTNAPDLERSFRSYRDRVRRAGEILKELDQQ